MEEKGSSEDPAQMPSGSVLSGLRTHVAYSTSAPNQHCVHSSNAMALRQWMYYPYMPQNCANVMSGASSSGCQASPYGDNHWKIASSSSPPSIVKSVPQMFSNGGWYGAPTGAANSMVCGKNVWYGMPQLEDELPHKLGSESSQSQIQDDISTTEGGSRNGVHQANVAILDLVPEQHNKAKKLGSTYETDRRRRKIIGERLKALQGLAPQSGQGHPGDVLEDTIDYIKYLQLQLKDLSHSRFGGESVSDPLVFIEGYGHYLVHEPMVNEPLDEMMGKLLEVNPQGAAALLESKGLCIRDMSLAKRLQDPV
uniref:BHLH domain-containing protein n=1 Tax=Kalanchoe fedtschenkoi TaxID=63787 RepID=A0A7N0TV90_KALFE